MSNWILSQLEFARSQTLHAVRQLSEEESEFIPEGLNNNVKWNLGHIYVVTEKFAFSLSGQQTELPDRFHEWFLTGTSPKQWTSHPPAKNELMLLLKQQLSRVQSTLADQKQLQKPLNESYTTSTGLHMATVGEAINFCIYHEAMHFAAIKQISRLAQHNRN